MDKIAVKVKFNSSSTLQFELMGLSEEVHEHLSILHGYDLVVNVYTNVLKDVTISPHPDVRLCLAWHKPKAT